MNKSKLSKKGPRDVVVQGDQGGVQGVKRGKVGLLGDPMGSTGSFNGLMSLLMICKTYMPIYM